MNNWKAYIRINGEDCSIFTAVDFGVEDSLYERIQNAIQSDKSLNCGELYEILYSKAEESFDLASYCGYSFEEEKPNSEDYEDSDEYESDLAIWEEDCNPNSLWEDYCIDSIDIYDPGDEKRFKQSFIGKKFFDGPGIHNMEFERNDIEIIATYNFDVEVDNNSIIIDVRNFEGTAMESESVRSSSWGECYPDFDYLESEFEEYLEESEEDAQG